MSEVLFAACTPNSVPIAGYTEHGYQINVLNESMVIQCTIDLPQWDRFQPSSAGHRLIEHGYVVIPGTFGANSIYGWRPVALGWMARVTRLGQAEEQPAEPAGATAVPIEECEGGSMCEGHAR